MERAMELLLLMEMGLWGLSEPLSESCVGFARWASALGPEPASSIGELLLELRVLLAPGHLGEQGPQPAAEREVGDHLPHAKIGVARVLAQVALRRRMVVRQAIQAEEPERDAGRSDLLLEPMADELGRIEGQPEQRAGQVDGQILRVSRAELLVEIADE